MRTVGIVAASLLGVGLLAYAVGLGIYAVASSKPVISTQPRSPEEARWILMRLGLDDLYPYEHRFLLTPHGRMHFADEGNRGGPVVLCLHGNGGWSLECAGVIRAAGAESRVVAPDLVGFGLSEKPSRVTTDDVIESHARDLAVLVELLELKDVQVIAAASSAPIAFELARLEPERVRPSVTDGGLPADARLVESLARTPVLGEVIVQGLGGLSPDFARGPIGRMQGSWDERASSLALARASH